MGELKHYEGSCHCGAIAFEADIDLNEVMSCNCSLCVRAGYLLTFVPKSQFKLVRGDEAFSDYQFGAKHLHHTFCKTCGVRVFGFGAAPDGSTMYAVNTRCIDDIELKDLKIVEYDGRSR